MSLEKILNDFKNGIIDEKEVINQLRLDYIDAIGSDVLFDKSRELRKGIPEVVYCKSKSPEKVYEILKNKKGLTIISKAEEKHIQRIKELDNVTLFPESGVGYVGKLPKLNKGKIGILTAGTSDVPIAIEAKVMAEAMGVNCVTFFDIGVAGVHRLIKPMSKLIEEKVSAIVVVAGMEGALPSVITSLSPVPVIGVPVSSGYGAGGEGIGALLGMLQSCSLGLTVVNIDNGIGAGATAALIAINQK